MSKITFILILFSLLMPGITSAQMPDRYVVLVIIDGARYSETLGDTSGKLTPAMKRLSAQGIVIDSFFNNGWTVTNRGVPAIWSGSWSTPLDTFYNGFQTQYATVPTLWEYFRKEHQQDSTKAQYIMKYLSSPWLQSFRPGYGPAYWPWYILSGSSDLQVWQKARTQLLNWHPRVSVVYLSDVDHYGHLGAWEDYTRAITVADSIVGLIWDLVQGDPVFRDKTTLMVTNDHGRHLDGVSTGFVGHGDGCQGCRRILLFGIGSGLKKGVHTAVKRYIPDIVPTIGTLLNFPTPVVSGVSMSEILDPSTGVENSDLPEEFVVEQNFPNPFNPETVIRYTLPARGSAISGFVKGVVYDITGREVATLVEGEMPAGKHQVTFNARGLPSGIYIIRLSFAGRSAVVKMVLTR